MDHSFRDLPASEGLEEEVITDMPTCIGCGKHPGELSEYVHQSEVEGMTPDDFVRELEGTYNPETGRFACTECYIAMGMPTAPGRGWKAPSTTAG